MTEERQIRMLYVSTLDRIISVMFPHLDAARARGWQVDVACRPTLYREDILHHADALHEIPLARFPAHPVNAVGLARLTKLIRQGNYDIVHCHNPTGGFIGRWATTLANQQSRRKALRVYTAHGFHFHRGGGRVSNLIYQTAESLAGRKWSDAVLVITREDFEAARSRRVVPEERLFLTHGVGVSAREQFDPALVPREDALALRRELDIPADATLITSVAELIPRKRHEDALAAFAVCHRSFPNTVLLIVGDGPLEDKLKRQAQAAGIENAVRIPGFRRDIGRILAASDIFLLASGQEGLPCVVQEALSMGVPVVASNVRGNADLVDDSCGWLATAGDFHALADQLHHALSLSALERQKRGKAGREKMLRFYDRTFCVAEWQEIYDKLLHKQEKEGETFRHFEG
jgi:glycosyltransferase involved in cell wall biosynthesis